MRKIISILLTCLLAIAIFTVSATASGAYVFYSTFGAVGDGVTCDFDAIYAAHAFANAQNRPVRATPGAVYYLTGLGRTVTIQTSTNWTDASFIIDNSIVSTALGQHSHNVFRVSSRLANTSLTGQVESLSVGQTNIGITLPQTSLVSVYNNNIRHYIRRGSNSFSPMRDLLIIDQNGNVDPATPIIWDFEQITSMYARPIDSETLYITGGHFTTIESANGWVSPYFHRGLRVERSNVVIDGLVHEVIDEIPGEVPPNNGFLTMGSAANLVVQNAAFAGRMRAQHGSYDIHHWNTVNVLFYNVTQTNDIHDWNRWGIHASNNTRNVTFDNVSLSRIDAHRSVNNLSILNSEIGYSGLALIGRGTLLVENTTVRSWNFITLRHDFGSTWDGDMILRNNRFIPLGNDVVLINSTNNGDFYFGHPTTLPHSIYIDGLVIDDRHLSFVRNRVLGFLPTQFYTGPSILGALHEYGNDALYITLFWDWLTNRNSSYPFGLTQEVTLRNVEVTSGRRLRLSKNIFRLRPRIFPNVSVTNR